TGLAVYPDSIETFSRKKGLYYDIVCSFQVLEHVPDVKSFLDASLAILKPGGLMIISVPNNDSFILRNGEILLDMPPHHMGLWNMNSLIKIQNHFPCEIQDIYIEPLQSYHVGFARKYNQINLEAKLQKKLGKFKKLLIPFTDKIIDFSIRSNSENMIGQTVLAVYQKK
ncbi:MAG: methyltransferase domain-containing protein, partial [Candidatus Parcubacteria bacterium]|nr:methyltransferase domain-containing protein [Candidatus Parcubacteria bacterium]